MYDDYFRYGLVIRIFYFMSIDNACFFFVFCRHLGSQLAELEKIIDMMLHADLIKYVTAELNRPITDLQALADEVGDVL